MPPKLSCACGWVHARLLKTRERTGKLNLAQCRQLLGWRIEEKMNSDQLQLYGDIFFQQINFANEHRDKRHDGRYQFARKRHLIFDILPQSV
jgi:hypothetical protein